MSGVPANNPIDAGNAAGVHPGRLGLEALFSTRFEMVRLRLLRSLLAAPITLAVLVAAPRVFADLLPPTSCDVGATAGQSCTTAGPSADEDGVCQTETCSSVNHLEDGGFGPPNTYSCLLCELVDAGPAEDAAPPPNDAGPPPPDAGPATPDAGPSPVPADAGTDAGGSATTELASSSSCAVANAGAGQHGPSSFFGLGAIGLVVSALSRRRRAK
jgi:MYXO-CTERM domain-containing protein